VLAIIEDSVMAIRNNLRCYDSLPVDLPICFTEFALDGGSSRKRLSPVARQRSAELLAGGYYVLIMGDLP
jgi:hypothetical protein